MLKLNDERKARAVPISYLSSTCSETSELNGSVKRITPTVHSKKQKMSCLDDRSPINTYEIMEVRKGLLIIRIDFETGMNSSENICSINPNADPNMRMHAYEATSLSILKGE